MIIYHISQVLVTVGHHQLTKYESNHKALACGQCVIDLGEGKGGERKEQLAPMVHDQNICVLPVN